MCVCVCVRLCFKGKVFWCVCVCVCVFHVFPQHRQWPRFLCEDTISVEEQGPAWVVVVGDGIVGVEWGGQQ